MSWESFVYRKKIELANGAPVPEYFGSLASLIQCEPVSPRQDDSRFPEQTYDSDTIQSPPKPTPPKRNITKQSPAPSPLQQLPKNTPQGMRNTQQNQRGLPQKQPPPSPESDPEPEQDEFNSTLQDNQKSDSDNSWGSFSRKAEPQVKHLPPQFTESDDSNHYQSDDQNFPDQSYGSPSPGKAPQIDYVEQFNHLSELCQTRLINVETILPVLTENSKFYHNFRMKKFNKLLEGFNKPKPPNTVSYQRRSMEEEDDEE